MPVLFCAGTGKGRGVVGRETAERHPAARGPAGFTGREIDSVFAE